MADASWWQKDEKPNEMEHKTKPAAPDNKLFKVPSESFSHDKSNV
jgi:hypothetical protein